MQVLVAADVGSGANHAAEGAGQWVAAEVGFGEEEEVDSEGGGVVGGGGEGGEGGGGGGEGAGLGNGEGEGLGHGEGFFGGWEFWDDGGEGGGVWGIRWVGQVA